MTLTDNDRFCCLILTAFFLHLFYLHCFSSLTFDFCTYIQGDYIWIEPISGVEFDVAIGAQVISAEGRRIAVRDDDGHEHWLQPDRRIKAMHTTSIHGVEDMISLGDLHEAGILRNLLIRYNENLIYVSPKASSNVRYFSISTYNNFRRTPDLF